MILFISDGKRYVANVTREVDVCCMSLWRNIHYASELWDGLENGSFIERYNCHVMTKEEALLWILSAESVANDIQLWDVWR